MGCSGAEFAIEDTCCEILPIVSHHDNIVPLRGSMISMEESLGSLPVSRSNGENARS